LADCDTGVTLFWPQVTLFHAAVTLRVTLASLGCTHVEPDEATG
jgi:hypothetical protein